MISRPMDPLALPEAVAGGALLFFLPGYAVAFAVFPERRGGFEGGLRGALEIATLSFVLSLALLVVVGYGLLTLSPDGFRAAWSDPLLEAALAGVTVVGVATGLVRGRLGPSPSLAPPDPEAGSEGAWELTRRLDLLRREEARITRSLRRAHHEGAEAGTLEERLTAVRAEAESLARAREDEFAR